MKKAIIFDNDGVLVNTEPLYFQATQEMCGELGKELSLSEFIDCHINSSSGTWHLVDVSLAEKEQWRLWRNQRYNELLSSTKNLNYDGVEQVIEELSQDFRLCIATSSKRSHFETIHRNNNYRRHFEFIVAREDVTLSKPSPEPYLQALQRLKLESQQCLIIEDSFRGLKAAQASNVDCVLVKNEFSHHLDLSGAQHYLDNIIELPSLIRSFQ